MNAGVANASPSLGGHRASPFKRRTVFLLVVASFLAFLALLALIGAGDTGRRSNDGGSHAAANGLNGYSGLVQLLELNDRSVTISRSPSGFGTYGLLVLTPPMNADAEDIQSILEDRFYVGPTLIILPKWYAQQLRDDPTDDIEIEDGWVRLLFTSKPAWIEELEAPYRVEVDQPWRKQLEDAAPSERDQEQSEETSEALDEVIVAMGGGDQGFDTLDTARWTGYGVSGELPDPRILIANDTPGHEPMVSTADGQTLVSSVWGEEDSDFYNDAYPVTFVIEPDLMNNYGLSDEARATAALAILEELTYEWESDITFDVSLNGLGGSENLLTLAFRPPFLAATLCLILALIVVGWRAFIRFGPALAESPVMAFGKRRLVTNGADLILRARRLRLLADPYIALVTRRIARRLGMRRADMETVSQALEQRMPEEEPLAYRAAKMRAAKKPAEILRAARALKELERKLET